MTVSEFHIGLDLYLKKLKSDVYGSLQARDKDYFLNLAIIDMINEKTRSIRDRYSMRENPASARTFYAELGNLIIVKMFDTYVTDFTGITSIELPKIDNVEVDSGTLEEGDKYVILERGSTVLSTVTTDTPLTNGTIFTVTTTGTTLPVWDGITTLERITDPFMLVPLAIDTNLVTDISFTAGKVLRGNKYFTSTGIMTSVKAGNIFIADEDTVTEVDVNNVRMAMGNGTFNGVDPTVTGDIATTIVKLNELPVNFMLPSERNILITDPVSYKVNPIAVLHDNSAFIHSDNIVHSVTFTYIKMPRRINYDLNINTDVSPVLHKEIVDRAGALLLGVINNTMYGSNKTQQQNPQS